MNTQKFHLILTKKQCEKLFQQLEIDDSGPRGETWDSDELIDLRNEITEQLAAQNLISKYRP